MELLDADSRGLRYLRVANSIQKRILDGVYQDGKRLPPQHQLAKSYGVAFNTLRQALDLLEREGYIVRELGSGTYAHLPRKIKRGVLIVDDDEAIRELFIRNINDEEWDVLAIGSGAEALEQLEQRTYDIMFLDLVMSGMNGAETLAAMRARDYDCPVVIITSYPDSALIAQVLEMGPVAMLQKPFGQRDLNSALERYARPRVKPQVKRGRA